jgi:hypothetical protein
MHWNEWEMQAVVVLCVRTPPALGTGCARKTRKPVGPHCTDLRGRDLGNGSRGRAGSEGPTGMAFSRETRSLESLGRELEQAAWEAAGGCRRECGLHATRGRESGRKGTGSTSNSSRKGMSLRRAPEGKGPGEIRLPGTHLGSRSPVRHCPGRGSGTGRLNNELGQTEATGAAFTKPRKCSIRHELGRQWNQVEGILPSSCSTGAQVQKRSQPGAGGRNR